MNHEEQRQIGLEGDFSWKLEITGGSHLVSDLITARVCKLGNFSALCRLLLFTNFDIAFQKV